MSESAQQPPRVIDAPLAEPVTEKATPREERARLSGYRRRFNAVYIALALATGIAVGAFIVITLNGETKENTPAAPSVRFTPSETGELGAMQIAESVQRRYRLPNGDELVNVVASRNTLQDGNLGFLRVRFQIYRPADALKDKDSQIEVADDAIQYSLCGVGPGCSIPGRASAERGLLVRRMGLELAIRTMQFDTAVDNVMVFLRPMPAGNSDGVVLVFRRGALERLDPSLLHDPLERTLPAAGAEIRPGQMSREVARRVDELTRPHLYYGQYQLLGGRDALLQLQPFPKG